MFFESAFYAMYFLLIKLKEKEARNSPKRAIGKCKAKRTHYISKKLKDYKIAIISDKLTYDNWSKECELYNLTPNNWKRIFEEKTIDLFFCESAWNGCNESYQCWRGRIYKNHKLLFESRMILFEILEYCKKNNIPTVFWNKEDPTYFGNLRYDFVDTALRFDYIFTTAEECVEKYKQRGHAQVYCMTFGFSPYFYNPLLQEEKKNRAIFAGSWFGEDDKRCQAEAALFYKVLNQKIPLIIYNRQSASKNSNRKFPQEFAPYVHSAVSQEQLGNEIKISKYAINVNTATDSETMFARRVYELMASNVYIISNAAKAMERQLKGRYSTLTDKLPLDTKQICRDNVDFVFKNHTNHARLIWLLEQIGLPAKAEPISVAVVSSHKSGEIVVMDEIQVKNFDDAKKITPEFQYFILWDGSTDIPIQKLLQHRYYLNTNCGICINENELYKIVENENNENVLFPIEVLKQITNNRSAKLKKYHI